MLKPDNLYALKANVEHMAAHLKLLSHPERLLMLCRMDEAEVSVNELVELSGLSQSSVSQHLAILRDAGVVSVRKDAQSRFYRLDDRQLRAVLAALCQLCEVPGDTV